MEKKFCKLNLFDLSNRVALVTGGGGGLARMFCEVLADFGVDVALADIDKEASERNTERVKISGRKALVVQRIDSLSCFGCFQLRDGPGVHF